MLPLRTWWSFIGFCEKPILERFPCPVLSLVLAVSLFVAPNVWTPIFWFASVHLRISHWSSKSGKQSDVAVAARRWSPWVVNHVRRPFRFHLNWQLIWILMWSVKRLVVPSLPLVIAFSIHLAQASDDSFAIWHVAVFHTSIWCVLHVKLGRPVMLFSNFPFH